MGRIALRVRAYRLARARRRQAESDLVTYWTTFKDMK